jgi:hypothetical protein
MYAPLLWEEEQASFMVREELGSRPEPQPGLGLPRKALSGQNKSFLFLAK